MRSSGESTPKAGWSEVSLKLAKLLLAVASKKGCAAA